MILINIEKNQSGVASMVIVILIMTILTLIVLSMTQNANREQRQALDRQLNAQAFYAAESGVSDLKDYIAQDSTAPDEKTDCDPLSADPDEYFPNKRAIVSDDPTSSIRYSCVLYDQTPDSLKYSNVGTSTPVVVPIEDKNGGNKIETLTFTWTQKDGGAKFTSCPSGDELPQNLTSDCQAGLLRISLINPGNPAPYDTAQKLSDNAFNGYFKPTNGGGAGSTNYASGVGTPEKQGVLVNAGCSNAGGCSATVTNIKQKKLFLKMSSLYKVNDVTINGTTIGSGPGAILNFKKAQAEVDVTGRANDILKRIRVRIDISGLDGELLPSFALQSNQSICKQLRVFPPDRVEETCDTVPASP